MSATLISVAIVKAAASGGRAVGIPMLAVAESLSGLVSARLAQSIADVRVALQNKSDAEAAVAEAEARVKVTEAAEAENRLTDQRRQEAEYRLLEAQAAKAENEAKAVDAQARKTFAEAELVAERTRQVGLANEELARAIRALKGKGGDVFVDVEQLQKLLPPSPPSPSPSPPESPSRTESPPVSEYEFRLEGDAAGIQQFIDSVARLPGVARLHSAPTGERGLVLEVSTFQPITAAVVEIAREAGVSLHSSQLR
jgi:hypothetical protein